MFYEYKEELNTQDSVIFRGERILIPPKLRKDILQRLHIGHLGIEGTTRRARELVFWPGMTAQIKDMIKKCDACNSFNAQQQKEPLKSLIPHRPWQMVATDIFHLE